MKIGVWHVYKNVLCKQRDEWGQENSTSPFSVRHSPLSSQNWKPTSSLLPTDLSCTSSVSIKPMTCMEFFFCSLSLSLSLSLSACVCVCVCGVCVLKWMCLSAFVSALGSHEMGRHKFWKPYANWFSPANLTFSCGTTERPSLAAPCSFSFLFFCAI